MTAACNLLGFCLNKHSFVRNVARYAGLLLVCSCTSGIGTAQTRVVGDFESETRFAAATWSIATGDFNGDGWMDFVSSSSDNTIVVFLGNGDGTFQPPVHYAANDPLG